MTGGRFLLLGDINIDTVWPVPEFPVPGRDGLVPQVSAEIGGAIVNSAFVFDHLSQEVSLLGCVGNDIWAEKVRQDLAATNIGQSTIIAKPGSATGLTFIIVTPDGERTMFSHRGANTLLDPLDIHEDLFEGTALLHLSGYALLESPQKDGAWKAIEMAQKFHVPISLDTGLDPVVRNPAELRRLLSALTICITGPQEIAVLYENCTLDEAVEEMISHGVQQVAVKMGEKGCRVYDRNENITLPSFHVNAVDSTGAGDSFTAGFLYGWAHAMSLSASAVLATALGALAATVYGAGSSLPDKPALLEFLRAERTKGHAVQAGDLNEVIAALENKE